MKIKNRAYSQKEGRGEFLRKKHERRVRSTDQCVKIIGKEKTELIPFVKADIKQLLVIAIKW
jgi:hypothetical protein